MTPAERARSLSEQIRDYLGGCLTDQSHILIRQQIEQALAAAVEPVAANLEEAKELIARLKDTLTMAYFVICDAADIGEHRYAEDFRKGFNPWDSLKEAMGKVGEPLDAARAWLATHTKEPPS